VSEIPRSSREISQPRRRIEQELARQPRRTSCAGLIRWHIGCDVEIDARRHVMRNIILSAGLAMVLAPVVIPAASIHQASGPPLQSERQSLGDFQRRVQQYAELHRRIEKTAPIPISKDWSQVRAAVDTLASRIRTERANATQGDVFTPTIERYFRLTLAECLESVDTDVLLTVMNEEGWKDFTLIPEVNGRWPEGVPLPSMPVHVLAVLPRLPPELEYRFMNRDLVLWDAHANVIVDYIKGALP
jgi:hypothetical protein